MQQPYWVRADPLVGGADAAGPARRRSSSRLSPSPPPLVADAATAAVRLAVPSLSDKPLHPAAAATATQPPPPPPLVADAATGTATAAVRLAVPSSASGKPHLVPAAAAAATAAQPPPRPLCLPPADTYALIAHHGEEKARVFSTLKIAVGGFAAGFLVGFGFALCLLIGGNLPASWAKEAPGLTWLLYGAVGFPFGFTCIVVLGGELFTSMCAYTTAAWWEGRVSVLDSARLLAVSWCANFAGCSAFLGLALAAGLFDGPGAGGLPKYALALQLARKKAAALSWATVFARGVLANMLVAFATWMSNAAQDLTGKAVGIWLSISAFAMFGLEHR
jgi:formate/nitrite transporter FocA (FNT family)